MSKSIACIITCTDDKHIHNCVNSIALSNRKIDLSCFILLQNNLNFSFDSYITEKTNFFVYHCENVIPLSSARNILLREALKVHFDYYMFPDDDSLFDSYFFSNFEKYISGNTLIAVKATQDRQSFFIKMPNKQFADSRDYHFAISVNMIIKSDVIKKVVFFDEKLGVGNYYGAGEDNDYFLRCIKYDSFTFSNKIWNYHPLQKNNHNLPIELLKKRYKSYGRGVIYMLVKHKMYLSACLLVCKGYCGAVISILKLNLKMTYIYIIAGNERLCTLIRCLNKKIIERSLRNL